jgi:pyruvate/2-oxoglutarate/acetoin dehydrogenase E1 component
MKGLMKSAIRDNNPVISFEHMALGGMEGEVPEDEYTIPFGQAVIRREGVDVTVVALAKMVNDALAVAEEMENEGISLEVIDPRTLVPLDRETIRTSVAKTGRLVVVDEACITCGVAAEIMALVVENNGIFRQLKSSPKRVCGLDVPIPYSPPMERYALPDRDNIIAAVREAMA